MDQKLAEVAKEKYRVEVAGGDAKAAALLLSFSDDVIKAEFTPFIKLAGLSARDMVPAYGAVVPEGIQEGDSVSLGLYEQNEKITHIREPIEWLVLKVQDGKALLISKYALDCQPYNLENKEIQWEQCTLRQWLNGTFLNYAFTEAEQNIILTEDVRAGRNLGSMPVSTLQRTRLRIRPRVW